MSGWAAQRKRRCFSDLNGMALFVPKLNVPYIFAKEAPTVKGADS
jgi:hypothetical protein